MWNVLSPDGFPISRDKRYCCEESAKIACKEWIDGYEKQGYYSTSDRSRIEFNNIWGHCKFIEEPTKSIQEYLDEEAVNNGWKNFNEVIYSSENRRTVQQIMDEAIALFEIEQNL